MTRKILYSPGWGAGWVSWNDGKAAEIMLTYQPIIDFIEAGNSFTDKDFRGMYASNGKSKTHPILVQMVNEIREATGNPDEYVCILGADDLRVATVSGRVRIDEYDGNESFTEEGSPENESEWR